MCIFGIKKYLLMNPMTIIVGMGHKPLFEDSPSECDGGVVTVRYGLISK